MSHDRAKIDGQIRPTVVKQAAPHKRNKSDKCKKSKKTTWNKLPSEFLGFKTPEIKNDEHGEEDYDLLHDLKMVRMAHSCSECKPLDPCNSCQSLSIERLVKSFKDECPKCDNDSLCGRCLNDELILDECVARLRRIEGFDYDAYIEGVFGVVLT